MIEEFIYLDNSATTPVDPRVVDTMLPYFYEKPGNAASRTHPFGWIARDAVTQAREQLATLIGAEPGELIFTSGATESNNLALKGVFERYQRKGRHIVTVSTEHKAVLDTCERIEKMGGEVTYLNVNREGLIDIDELAEAIRPDTILVSIMYANNETGVLQPLEAIGALCESRGVLLMSDATQAVGKIPIDVRTLGVHLMAFTAHKMYGPKGIGALYVRRRKPRVQLTAQIDGGGHEKGMRSGTLNVPSIVGFGKAAELCQLELVQEAQRLRTLRDQLESSLLAIGDVQVNGHQTHRLPHLSNLCFRFVDSGKLISKSNHLIAISSGSACTSALETPSHVLQEMGLGDDLAKSSVRFSLGRFTKAEDIERAVDLIKAEVTALRQTNPAWTLYQEGIIE